MVEVTIVNSFFIFNKIIDQFFICTLFAIILIITIKNKLKYLTPMVTLIALIFASLDLAFLSRCRNNSVFTFTFVSNYP